VGRGGGTPGDQGVARGEGLGGVGTGHWRGGARTTRGDGWRRVGIRGVAGGGAPGDRGVVCGEGLGGVGTGDWRSGAQMARGSAWGSEGWQVAAQGDRRGGVALDWCGRCGDWLVVTLRKRNTKCVG
jgi:hypothetical protein